MRGRLGTGTEGVVQGRRHLRHLTQDACTNFVCHRAIRVRPPAVRVAAYRERTPPPPRVLAGRDRSEETVRLLVGAGREEERSGRTRRASEPELERPQAVDRERLALRAPDGSS